MSTAFDRFLRVIGGQVLGAAVMGVIAYVAGNPGDPIFFGFGSIIGAALTALDKYLRDQGLYGTSLEAPVKPA